MATLLSLTNNALAELGKPPVIAITDNEAAQALAAAIVQYHPQLLELYPWPWAIVYWESSTPLLNALSPDFRYSYQLPADYGQFFRWSTVTLQWAYYEFIDGTICTNTLPVSMYYVSNSADFTVISPLYADMLSTYAAAQRALILTDNVALTQYLNAKYTKAMTSAIKQADMQRSVVAQVYNDYNRTNFV